MIRGGGGNQEDIERFGGKVSKTHSFLSSALLLFILSLGENQKAFPQQKSVLHISKNLFLAPRWRTKGRLPTLPALTCLQIFQRQKSGRNIPETKTCLQIFQRQKSGKSLSTELPLSKCECKQTYQLLRSCRKGKNILDVLEFSCWRNKDLNFTMCNQEYLPVSTILRDNMS